MTKQRWQLRQGDALDVLRDLLPQSVDAVVTDPPYGIGLRGAAWDNYGRASSSFVDWNETWARECLRVIKPGGWLLAFGAPRTVHQLATGIERAGFELRDQLLWLYGTGLPKSRLHGGRGTALNPAYEPILLARAPLRRTLDENEQRFGTGRLGIDDCRLKSSDRAIGRWPANVTLSHHASCRRGACAPRCAVRALDQASGVTASRFFYCAKPSRVEREAGCAELRARRFRIYGGRNLKPRRNTHPTVKPIDLMRWLIRLACPPGGIVVDPFAGSGSTGIAAIREGRSFVGIEREPEYLEIARARLEHAAGADGGTVDATVRRVRRTVIRSSERRN